MKKLLMTALAFATLSSSAKASIIFSNSVPQEQKQLIASDLLFLAKAPFVQDAVLASLMGIATTDGLSLVNWIDNRLNYIVSQDFNAEKNLVQSQSSFQYDSTPLPEIPDTSHIVIPKDVHTVMTNIGGAYFIGGKLSHQLIALNIDGKLVELRSPRSGLFQVGDGMVLIPQKRSFSAEVARAFRLSTLIHESRHSDGRGTSIGFLHRLCPATHRFANLPACDKYSNGPYIIEAQFLKAYVANCVGCTSSDKEILNSLVLDSAGRVVAEGPLDVDKELNEMQLQANEMLLQICGSNCPAAQKSEYQKQIAQAQQALLPKTSKTSASAVKGDPTPEGQFTTVDRNQTWATVWSLAK